MKIRPGFVSNSSSSSYTCESCGDVVSGYDINFAQWGITQFSCGHFFHDDCAKQFMCEKEAKEFEAYQNVDECEDDYERRAEADTKFCPACNLRCITDQMLLQHFLKKSSMTREEAAEEVRKARAEEAK